MPTRLLSWPSLWGSGSRKLPGWDLGTSMHVGGLSYTRQSSDLGCIPSAGDSCLHTPGCGPVNSCAPDRGEGALWDPSSPPPRCGPSLGLSSREQGRQAWDSMPCGVPQPVACPSKDILVGALPNGAGGPRWIPRNTTLGNMRGLERRLSCSPLRPRNLSPQGLSSQASLPAPWKTFSRPLRTEEVSQDGERGPGSVRGLPDVGSLRSRLWNLAGRIRRCPLPRAIPRRAIFLALRRLVAAVLGRALTLGDAALWRTLHDLLQQLPSVQWLVVLLLEYYPDLSCPAGPVAADVANAGLGARGCFPIPQDIWDHCVPRGLVDRLKAFPDSGSVGPRAPSGTTSVMLRALARDGFLRPCAGTPNATCFLRPKTATKAAFIADLRAVNAQGKEPRPVFSLPCMEDVGRLISRFPPGTLWGCTVDITNFYWSLRLPDSAVGCFRVMGLTWDCLPFGWDRSPVLAQLTLCRLVRMAFRDPVSGAVLWVDFFLFIYYDDILLLATSPVLAGQCVGTLCMFLAAQGLLVSPKSTLTPAQQLVWLGKHIDLARGCIRNTSKVLLHVTAMAVLLPCVPCFPKLMERVLGYLMWAFRPHVGAPLFLAAWYRERYSGRRFWAAPTGAMIRGLHDLVALAFRPWWAPRVSSAPFQTPVLCGDAARHSTHYQVALFGPQTGARLVHCPMEIMSQQTAELFAFDSATRLAVRLGWRALTYVGDNTAVLHLVLRLRPSLQNQVIVKLIRRIRNRLLWSRLTVHLVWVPSPLQPADALSRCPLILDQLEAGRRRTLDCWSVLMNDISLARVFGVVMVP